MSNMRIVELATYDVRFPTSSGLHGSDAMNVDPDYSAAYVVLRTDHGPTGHGSTFTIGRGNELCVAAIDALRELVVGRDLDGIRGDMAAFWRSLVADSQLRWVGPEKGVVHLAVAAVVNAVWDLIAKVEGKPLWKLLVDMSADELVACIDFRYLTDALTPDEARDLLTAREPQAAGRERDVLARGLTAYTTSVGWIGYSDDVVHQAIDSANAAGFRHFKMKVGRDPAEDLRRGRLIREALGPGRWLMADANQVWDVPTAIARVRELTELDLWWIEEPTSPDDVLGHARIREAVAPVRVATGEQCHNRVMFKQFLQADALDVVQIDACRVGGVNENLAILLMAAKFGKPVCPHAGGVGLCEAVQHLAIFDAVRVAASREEQLVEYVDLLHEHFVDPVRIRDGHYVPPQCPGGSTELTAAALADHEWPHGRIWRR